MAKNKFQLSSINENQPLKFLFTLAFGIFLAEVIAMVVVYFYRPHSYFFQILLDGLVMTILILPILYTLSFRPLIMEIGERKRVEEALRQAYEEQETKIIERTADLADTNQTLEAEIGERKRAEAALREALEVSQRRQEEVAGLLEGAQAVLENQEFSGAAKAIFDIAKRLIGADAGYITIIEDGQNKSIYLDAGSIESKVDPDTLMPIRGLRQAAYETRSVVVENQFRGSPTEIYIPSGHSPMENVLFAPLILKGEAVGLLGLGNKPAGFNHNDVRLAQGFAEIAAIALWNSQNLDALRRAHDKLEQRVFERTLELEKAVSALQQENQERRRAEEQLRRQADQLEALRKTEREQRLFAESLAQAAQALNASLALDNVFETILDQARKVIPYEGAGIMLKEGDTVYIARHRGRLDIEAIPLVFQLPDMPMFETMMQEKLPVAYEDIWEESSDLRYPALGWVRSVAAAPLFRQERFFGFIVLLNERPDQYDKPDLAQLMAFAAHASIAMDNAHLYEVEMEARQLAERLVRTSTVLTQSLELGNVIGTLLDELGHLIPYDSANLVMFEDGDYPVVEAQRGYQDWSCVGGLVQMVFNPQHNPHLHKMLESLESVEVNDLKIHPWWQEYAAAVGIESWLGLPLTVGGRMLGFCSIEKQAIEPYTPRQIQVAQAVVGQAVIAIQNAWLFNQVRSGHTRLRHFSHWLVQVQENERRYVARELHDEAGQALASLMMGLRVLEKEASQYPSLGKLALELKSTAGSVLENVHRLGRDLRPASLEHLGLGEALAQYIRSLEQEDLEIAFDAEKLSGYRMAQELETNLYRIVQEALSNVIRHARARHVIVSTKMNQGCLVLTVEDDGCGFDLHEARSKDRLGLLGMQERVEMFGGTLVVESHPGLGTKIIAEVPYANTVVNCR